MKRIFIILIIALSSAVVCKSNLMAQTDLTNVGFDREREMNVLSQDSVKVVKKYKSLHMVGIRYSYGLCSARVTPDMGTHMIQCPLSFSVLYTYYNALWDMMPNFGIQLGFNYGEEGIEADYMDSDMFKVASVHLVSQFKFDFSRFRLLANVGPYFGYRLSNARENGEWNRFDNRYDYGIMAGLGFAAIFEPFEIQVEGNYKFSLTSMYHVNKYSDQYWLLAYPSNIMLSVSLFVHLW